MIARGARPQTSPLPLTREVEMRNPFAFAALPVVEAAVRGQVEGGAGARSTGIPRSGKQFREDLKNPASFGDWARITVHEVKKPH